MDYLLPLLLALNERCVIIVRIRSFSGPYFPSFGQDTERCGVSLRIQSECRKMQARKTLNKNTIHGVEFSLLSSCLTVD